MVMKIPPSESIPIDMRLGDVDLKTPQGGKAEYWRAIERSLIDEGWYTGTEDDPESDKTWCAELIS